jgi:thiol:disulfide interchange protein DsbC
MVAKRLVMLVALCGAAVWSALPAQPTPQQAPQAQPNVDPRVAIASRIPGARPEELRPSPIAGVYELTRGADIAYVTADGKYAITGDLYDLVSNDNLTEHRRRALRVKAITAVPESEMVVFGPAAPKYTVTVFTDVDCPYCRQLHGQIGEYNRLGVQVRYLFFPRSGPETASWTKAEQVWCPADRKDALTRAKLGQELKTKPCAKNPVARTYALGKSIAIEGTPAIILANGELLPGYVPPDVLVQHLKDVK